VLSRVWFCKLRKNFTKKMQKVIKFVGHFLLPTNYIFIVKKRFLCWLT